VLSDDAATRAFVVNRSREAGARVLRIPVSWRDYVSGTAAGSDLGDPASHAYHFDALDAAVRAAVAAGLEPLLVVAHAPEFAEAPHRWTYAYAGSWAPSPPALEMFAAALARRYDGSFPDPLDLGRSLPLVRFFQAWNEPNLPRYLEPQWIAVGGRWHAFSPVLYRALLNAFYAGVKAVMPSDLVVGAGLAPVGEPTGMGRMAPVRFLRSMFCLTSYPAAHRVTWCGPPAHLDILAYHPLSVASPDRPARSSLDVAVADAGKISTVLGQARRLGTVMPTGPKPLWITELNWESAPQSARGVTPSRQAHWISRALHRLWIAGAQLVDWQFLIDPYPALKLARPTGGEFEVQRPAGLYSSSVPGVSAASPKPFLLGFEFPFDPVRVDRRVISVWAVPPVAAHLALQRELGGRWLDVTSLKSDRDGVVNELVSMSGGGRLRVVDGDLASATESVGHRRPPSLAHG
jgi:hypothetical protein